MKRNIAKVKKSCAPIITIICEGTTEKNYVKKLLQDYDLLNGKIKLITTNGGGFAKTCRYIEKNSKILDIVLVLMDLDICNNSEQEKRNLSLLISTLERQNEKNNIFLSYPNFEIRLAKSIDHAYDERSLMNLGYQKGEEAYEFVKKHSGKYERAQTYFKDKPLYFRKPNFDRGVRENNNIDKNQSSLHYFIDYVNCII